MGGLKFVSLLTAFIFTFTKSCEGCQHGQMSCDPCNLNVYLWCVHGSIVRMNCQATLLCNEAQQVFCDHAHNVDTAAEAARCNQGSTAAAPSTESPSTTPQANPTSNPSTPTLSATTRSPQPTGGPLNYLRVCYYTNWAQYRSGVWKFFPENVDPSLCTHIVYAFAKLDSGVIKTLEWNDDTMYGRIMQLKNTNPSLKVLISVGGWNAESVPFSNMASTQQKRQTFIQSVVDFCNQWEFDGFDIDWEYPTFRDGLASDKVAFTKLIKEFSQAFDDEARTSGNPKLLLAAAFGVGADKINNAYEIAKLHQYFDFMSLMTYDLWGLWEGTIGYHNALSYTNGDQSTTLNAKWAVEEFIRRGAPANKLILGIALYGRGFKLLSPSQRNVGDTYQGAPSNGPQTQTPGFLSYFEICQHIKNDGWTHGVDTVRGAAYAYSSQEWFGYESKESVKFKTNYIKDQGLGGAMVWALDYDDFRNQCGGGVNPVLTTIRDELISAKKREQVIDNEQNVDLRLLDIIKSIMHGEELKKETLKERYMD